MDGGGREIATARSSKPRAGLSTRAGGSGSTSRAHELWGTGLPWGEELQGESADGQLPTSGGRPQGTGTAERAKQAKCWLTAESGWGVTGVGSLASWFQGHSAVVLFLL